MILLHLMNDEKFTDFSISVFENCNPGNNIFLVSRTSKAAKFKIKKGENIKHFISGSKKYFNFINNCKYDVLVIHFLDYTKCKVINKLKFSKIIVWLAWGGDIYNTIFYKFSLYQPYTEQLVKETSTNDNLKTKFKNQINFFFYFLSIKKPPFQFYKNAIRKINYCATVIPNEFEILCQWKFFNAKQVYFSYGSIEYDFKDIDLSNSDIKGNSILIGNSMSPSSNHLDVIQKLKSFEIGKRKIIAPLNYGNEIEYRNKIIEEGKNAFRSNWYPLLEFVSKKEYIEIIRDCNVAIMNHNRQQGIGNLVLLFWMGCKIFLSEKSVTYKYFKSKGFIVYSFQNELNEENLNSDLSQETIKRNRELIKKEYGNDKVIERTKQLINTLKTGETHYLN